MILDFRLDLLTFHFQIGVWVKEGVRVRINISEIGVRFRIVVG